MSTGDPEANKTEKDEMIVKMEEIGVEVHTRRDVMRVMLDGMEVSVLPDRSRF